MRCDNRSSYRGYKCLLKALKGLFQGFGNGGRVKKTVQKLCRVEIKKELQNCNSLIIKSPQSDSNQRPTDYKSVHMSLKLFLKVLNAVFSTIFCILKQIETNSDSKICAGTVQNFSQHKHTTYGKANCSFRSTSIKHVKGG